jgi:lipopolysaccharide transport system ATP-binding protein
MSEPIITVENLSKCYRIGAKEQGYKTIREVILDGFKAPIRNLRQLRGLTKFNSSGSIQAGQKNASDVFWALKDVSFEVEHGEVLGIIGRNGAGKTTLLKVLSRITEPTAGDVKIYGRVSSLLEVGTGFHPELTGRENIYLNAAILGMRKTEIEQKFDEIVSFAEIERFIDTPVKRYSSGMYVRLAFAVAAHLEPDILIVDEVLAVGDAAFQKKSLGKMDEVSKSGRTILFVSHNMSAISSLCSQTLVLREGRVEAIGGTNGVIKDYMRDIGSAASIPVTERIDRIGQGRLRFTDFWFEGPQTGSTISSGEPSSFFMKVSNKTFRDLKARLALSVKSLKGEPLLLCDTGMRDQTLIIPSSSEEVVACKLGNLPLREGEYLVNIAAFVEDEPEDWIAPVAKITVSPSRLDGKQLGEEFPVFADFGWSVLRTGKEENERL